MKIMKSLRYRLIFMGALLAGVMALTCQVASAGNEIRPKIGLVLSGGGARGAAHIGVLKVLEDLNVPIDYIAGTSMGSIVGGLYAAGMPLAEIESIVTSMDWDGMLTDSPPRNERTFRRKQDDVLYLVKSKPGFKDGKLQFPSGLIQGQNIDLFFRSITLQLAGIHSFDDLSIPFHCVATDISTGNAVVLDSGDLALSMRASMSVPAIFAPVEINGSLLVDGGLSNNLPVDVVRGMGAEIVIAVDISTPLLPRNKISNILTITAQLTGFLTRKATEVQIASLTDQDILIVPDLADIETGAFKRVKEAITRGTAGALVQKEKLVKLSLQVNKPFENAARREPIGDDRPVIDFITFDNRSHLRESVIRSYITVETGIPLDLDRLEADIARLYGLELFELIQYQLVKEDGRTGLLIKTIERSWGPNYLQLGISLSSSNQDQSYFNLGASYLKTGLNSLGGEARFAFQIGREPAFGIDYFQYLDPNSRYFVQPRIAIIENDLNVFEDGDQIAEYTNDRWIGELALGRETGNWGEVRLGWRAYLGDAEIKIGDPAYPDYDFTGSELFAKLSYDTLDSLNFPNYGALAHLEYTISLESLGADSDFEQIQFAAFGVKTWGRNTLFGGGRFSTTLGSDAPPQNLFQQGGLFNLSGFYDDELSGQHEGLIEAGGFRKINTLNLFPIYIGGSIECGNVWDAGSDISFDSTILAGSVFIGVDTFLGPIMIAYGHAEGGRYAIYFSLGKVIISGY